MKIARWVAAGSAACFYLFHAELDAEKVMILGPVTALILLQTIGMFPAGQC
jgi:hypothetical protein